MSQKKAFKTVHGQRLSTRPEGPKFRTRRAVSLGYGGHCWMQTNYICIRGWFAGRATAATDSPGCAKNRRDCGRERQAYQNRPMPSKREMAHAFPGRVLTENHAGGLPSCLSSFWLGRPWGRSQSRAIGCRSRSSGWTLASDPRIASAEGGGGDRGTDSWRRGIVGG